jgi:lysophospholipase L1-like esterase
VLAVTLAAVGVGRSDVGVDAQLAQPDVVIVGDSLTGGNASYIGPVLRTSGVPNVRVEGLSARRIAVSFQFLGYRDSGIERIRSLKASGIRPKLWVVQLGTNDLGVVGNCACEDPVLFAGALIDRLLAEIGPSTPTAWVTVLNRDDYDVSNTFNEALRRRAAVDPYLRLIDWSTLSLGRPDWFVDAVHPGTAGLVGFTEMYVREISALLRDLPGPVPERSGTQQAVRLGSRLR